MAFEMECLYEEKDLKYWQTRYPTNIQWNFDNLILERVTQTEKAKLIDVRLDFPLVGRGDMKNDPIAYYSHPPSGIVTLPIYSIKFYDDISIAAAWLEMNGYSQETIMDYISLLKYANPLRFPGGKIPPPREALYIPENALDNRVVDGLSQKVLKSSIVWILAHELGHILYSHPSYDEVSIEEAQDNEREADSFATEMFRRIGIPPAGMAIFFTVLVHWLLNRGDFLSDAVWEEYVKKGTTHPVSRERIHSISQELKASPDDFGAAEPNSEKAKRVVMNIAGQMEGIAKKLEPGVQRLIRARALAVTLETLKPRKIGEISVSGYDDIVSFDKSVAFNGMYQGLHTRKLAEGKTESLNCCLMLERSGNDVVGRFNFGVGEGTLEGQVVENELHFDWKWGDTFGRGVLQQEEAMEEFSGNWGYEDSKDNGGSWSGKRD